MTETRHINKFMGGAMTPEEAHRKLGLRTNCALCGAPAAIRYRVFMPMDKYEEKKRNGEVLESPIAQTIYGDMARVADHGFCDLCKKAGAIMMREDFGDSVIVDTDEMGLSSSHKILAQVPGAFGD